MIKRVIALLPVLLFVASVSYADQGIRGRILGGVGVPSGGGGAPSCEEGVSLAAGAHPRFYFNVCERDEMVDKMTSGLYSTAIASGISYVESNWTNLHVLNTGCVKNVQSITSCVHFAAFIAAIYETYDDIDPTFTLTKTKSEYGTKGVQLFDTVIALGWDPVNGTGISDENGSLNGFAYDWLYDALVAGGKDDDVAAFLDDLTSSVAARCADPPLPSESLINTFVDMCWGNQTINATAILNDHGGATQTWASAMYNLRDEKYRDSTGLTNVRTFLMGTTGGDVPEGKSYETNYAGPATWVNEDAWRSAHYETREDYFGTSATDGFKSTAKYFANLYFPWEEGTGTPRFHSPYRSAPGAAFQLVPQLGLVYLQGMYEWDTDTAGLFRWVTTKAGYPSLSGAQAAKYSILLALMGPVATPTTRSPADLSLPLNTYAHNTRFYFRENWSDTDAGLVMVEAGKWIRSQVISPQQVCGFALFRDGFNVFSPGANNNSFGPDQWPGWGNYMTFRDTSSLTPENAEYYRSYGGRRKDNIPQLNDTAALTDVSAFNGLTSERHSYAEAANGMTAIDLDCAVAYKSTQVTTYKRKYGVSVQSDRLQLWSYARTVTPSTTFQQADIVNFPKVFTSDGSESAGVTPVRKPSPCPNWTSPLQCSTGGSDDTLGFWTITGATTLEATSTDNGADGKMRVTIGLPASRVVVKMGGPDNLGNSFNGTDIFSMEGVDQFGVRVDQGSNGPAAEGILTNYISQYRAEITATTTATTQNFFKFHEVLGNASTYSTVTYFLTGTTRHCGLAENASVNIGRCFGSTGETLTSGTMVFDGLQSVTRVFKICDMSVSASHSFTFGSGAGSNITSINGDSDGTYAFTSDSGGCVLASIVFGASASNSTVTQAS